MAKYSIRTMSREDLDYAVNWAAIAGWNPGLQDADCFYEADPSGFLMGYLDEEPIAAISAVKYGDTFGFLGFYIVRPPFRGQGYGLQIWQAGLNALQGRTVGLDGVVEQQGNYLKSGFKLAYRNVRYEGWGASAPDMSEDAAIAPLSAIPFATLLQYDRPFFPDDRTRFLQCWVSQPNSTAIGLLQNNDLAGYGVLRPCREGYKMGPLFADTPAYAERLFTMLKAKVPRDAPFYLDVPEVNGAAIALAERHGMTSMFETARMYRPAIPSLPTDRIFGVTTFELG